MPHLTLEYTSNLPLFKAADALLALNKLLLNSGEFEALDIKSRAIRLDTYLVGTHVSNHPDNEAFVHVKLALLSGRSAQLKQTLSAGLLQVLEQACAWPKTQSVQLCVELQDIERASYAKSTGLGAAEL
ncbi:5-carboxymethyl-2-hydroxymuconate Delta-isomerase [Paucibacter sp. TC2R-5]|uniref:5-carboxymethyl-2-hydroxymuconate Delta-isomerase n=1 Tax=Paucibacter sp. TC2R-5 TaxID=2893555 RepID=UPI0021E3BBFA|nr:5-carboxymethyl-2-hydroxymuconate Delta-isomerase [Paucibacter sp. TC2R-5]MCV2360305.1 5-carboxymethyl-2-hydroxymuconate Delta-isomerase [Paucibacter sp. TC2R-5]